MGSIASQLAAQSRSKLNQSDAIVQQYYEVFLLIITKLSVMKGPDRSSLHEDEAKDRLPH